MEQLEWEQINAWRLSRRGLAELAGAICGLHAQLATCAALSLWARGRAGVVRSRPRCGTSGRR